MPNAPEVGFTFGAEGDQSLLSVIRQLRIEMGTLKQQQDQVAGSSQGADRAFKGMSESAALTTRQMREAKGEAALLGETVGIRLPRHVRNFLAELPGVANLLTAAFSATAVLFLVDALIELPGKIAAIADSLAGWAAEAKKAYDQQIKLNEAYLEDSQHAEKERRHENEAGLQGAALTRQKLANQPADVAQNKAETKVLGEEIARLQQKVEGDDALKSKWSEGFQSPAVAGAKIAAWVLGARPMSDDDRKRAEGHLEELNGKLRALKREGGELPREGKKLEGQLGREDLQEAIALGKQKIEAQDAAATHAAQLDLQHQKEDLQTREAQDKAAHDAGILSLKEYYSRRADAIRDGVRNEQKAIESQRTAAQTELTGLKALPVGPTAQDRAARLREEEAVQQRIDALNERYYDLGNDGERSLIQLVTEQNKAELDLQLKRLEMQKELAHLQGNGDLTDQIEEKIDRLHAIEAVLYGEMTEAEAGAYIQSMHDARVTKTTGDAAQKTFQTGIQGLEERKADLQEKVASGQMQPYEAARLLRQEYQAQVEALQQQIKLLQDLAHAHSGTDLGDEYAAKAVENEKALIRFKAELDRQDVSWMSWKTTARESIDSVSTDMTSGLNGMITAHQRFSQAVAQSWNRVVMTGVNAAEKLLAHWIATQLKMLLIKRTNDQANVVGTAVSGEEQNALEKKHGIKSVFIAAKVAAAKAWKAHAENPIVGAVLAALTFAGVMAFAAFDQGGVVDKRQHAPVATFAGGSARSFRGMVSGPGGIDKVPAYLTHGESVLTTRATHALGKETVDALNRGDFAALRSGAFLPPIRLAAPYSATGLSRYAAANAFTPSPGRAGGGDLHFSHTTHIEGLQALDGASVRAALEEHGDLIGSIAVASVQSSLRQSGVNR